MSGRLTIVDLCLGVSAAAVCSVATRIAMLS
jgi:hypothetical protein